MANTLKLMIRQDGPTINAYLPLDMNSEKRVVIASLRTAVAEMHPPLFEAFQAFATLVAQTLLEGIGAKIESVTAEKRAEATAFERSYANPKHDPAVGVPPEQE